MRRGHPPLMLQHCGLSSSAHPQFSPSPLLSCRIPAHSLSPRLQASGNPTMAPGLSPLAHGACARPPAAAAPPPPPLAPPLISRRCRQAAQRCRASNTQQRAAAAPPTDAAPTEVAAACRQRGPLQHSLRRHLQQRGTRWRSSSDGGTGPSGSSGNGSGKEPGGGGGDVFQNPEILVGDCLCLLCFALYKQVRPRLGLASWGCCPWRASGQGAGLPRRAAAAAAGPLHTTPLPLTYNSLLSCVPPLQITAIILAPAFPGWLAPLAFNPLRFLEFFSFTTTLVGTWVASGMLLRGYKFGATADVQTALM